MHRASGGEARHKPGNWLMQAQTTALVRELGDAGIPAGPVAIVNDVRNNGTYVCRELVYAYAMWISPAFHLKVIRAYDAQHVPRELTRLEVLTLAMEAEQARIKAEAALAIAAPKAAFVDKYVEATGLKGFREVCKLLNANEAEFRRFLDERGVMYRLAGTLTAYQAHVDAGRFATKAGVSEVNGHAYNTTKFTPKGVEWVAGEWAKWQLRQTGLATAANAEAF